MIWNYFFKNLTRAAFVIAWIALPMSAQSKTVAVHEASVQGSGSVDQGLLFALRDHVEEDLRRQGYKVITKEELQTVLTEQEYKMLNDLVDREKFTEMGKSLYRYDYVFITKVTPLSGSKIRVSYRMIEIKTGKIKTAKGKTIKYSASGDS